MTYTSTKWGNHTKLKPNPVSFSISFRSTMCHPKKISIQWSCGRHARNCTVCRCLLLGQFCDVYMSLWRGKEHVTVCSFTLKSIFYIIYITDSFFSWSLAVIFLFEQYKNYNLMTALHNGRNDRILLELVIQTTYKLCHKD